MKNKNLQESNLKIEAADDKPDSLEAPENNQEKIELEKAEKKFQDWQDNYWDRRSDGSTVEDLDLEKDDLLENIERKRGRASFYKNSHMSFEDGAKLRISKQERDNSAENTGAYHIAYDLPEDGGHLIYVESKRNSNEWHITANMPNNDKTAAKEAFERVGKVLPKDAVIFEDMSISLDGLRVWAQQLKHGYVLEGNITSPDLSDMATDKLFRDLDLLAPGTKWSAIKFKDSESALKGKARLEEFLKNNDLDFPVVISTDYTIKILLPKLKKL